MFLRTEIKLGSALFANEFALHNYFIIRTESVCVWVCTFRGRKVSRELYVWYETNANIRMSWYKAKYTVAVCVEREREESESFQPFARSRRKPSLYYINPTGCEIVARCGWGSFHFADRITLSCVQLQKPQFPGKAVS